MFRISFVSEWKGLGRFLGGSPMTARQNRLLRDQGLLHLVFSSSRRSAAPEYSCTRERGTRLWLAHPRERDPTVNPRPGIDRGSDPSTRIGRAGGARRSTGETRWRTPVGPTRSRARIGVPW